MRTIGIYSKKHGYGKEPMTVFSAPVAGAMFLRRKLENPVSFAAARIGT
jgi:hypothetical protein